MNYAIWSLVASIAILFSLSGVLVGGEKSNPTPRSSAPRFALEDSAGVERLRISRELAINEAVSVLRDHADGKVGNIDTVVKAAMLLGDLRADGDPSLSALCGCIDVKSCPATGIGPLSGFVAAESLANIGGRKAQSAVIQLLRRAADDRTRLICAFVLQKSDDLQIVLTRIDLAIELERKKPLAPSGPDLTYLASLEQVKKWLRDGAFLRDRANWPSCPLN